MAKKAQEYTRDIRVPRGTFAPEIVQDHVLIGRHFVPWGRDNLQPNRVLNAISNSPTAAGASSVYSSFLHGQGFLENGHIVVNRSGQTLNDILEFVSNQQGMFGGEALHFNVNLNGQINEIQMLKIHQVRVGRNLDDVIIQDWDIHQGIGHENTFPIYDAEPGRLADQVRSKGGFKTDEADLNTKHFKGVVFWKPANLDIYPSLFSESAILSFEFEKDVQMTNLSFIKNGMKSSGVFKLPSQTSGTEDDASDAAKIEKLHSPEHAGSIITINMPKDAEGSPSSVKLFEAFDIPNMDKMFVNQVKTAKDYILSGYNMPEILLGISSQGMFNSASFSEAFTYFNGKTQGKRVKLERLFNGFMKNTVWELDDLKIAPLSLDQFTQVSKEPIAPVVKLPVAKVSAKKNNKVIAKIMADVMVKALADKKWYQI